MILKIDPLYSKASVIAYDLVRRPGFDKELRDAFKQKSIDAHRSTAYKEGRWDGMIRFMDRGGRHLTGLSPLTYKMAKQSGLSVDVRMPVVECEPTYVYDDIVAYDYQKDMLDSVFAATLGDRLFPRGIIDAATNAGKTVMILLLHASYKKTRTLMLIHNRELFKQHIEFYSKYFPVGKVGDGKVDFQNFTIAMYKTLLNRTKSVNVKAWLAGVQQLYIDESHNADAKGYKKLRSLIPANVVYYVSGTPLKFRDPIRKISLIGYSGPVVARISNKELIEKGQSQNAIVIFYRNPGQLATSYDNSYAQNIKFSKHRINAINYYLNKYASRTVLIEVFNLDHGQYMHERIPGSVFLHADSEDRDQIVQDFKEGRIRVLITTLIKEGINTKVIDTLIYTSGGKDPKRLLQYAGRALRRSDHDDDVHLVDFYDEGPYVNEHSKKRFDIYKQEQFKIYKDEIKN